MAGRRRAAHRGLRGVVRPPGPAESADFSRARAIRLLRLRRHPAEILEAFEAMSTGQADNWDGGGPFYDACYHRRDTSVNIDSVLMFELPVPRRTRSRSRARRPRRDGGGQPVGAGVQLPRHHTQPDRRSPAVGKLAGGDRVDRAGGGPAVGTLGPCGTRLFRRSLRQRRRAGNKGDGIQASATPSGGGTDPRDGVL